MKAKYYSESLSFRNLKFVIYLASALFIPIVFVSFIYLIGLNRFTLQAILTYPNVLYVLIIFLIILTSFLALIKEIYYNYFQKIKIDNSEILLPANELHSKEINSYNTITYDDGDNFWNYVTSFNISIKNIQNVYFVTDRKMIDEI